MIRSEQLFCAFDGYFFHYVHILATAVIAATRISLGVFIGKYRACGKQHRLGHYVLRRYKFDVCALTIKFVLYRRIHFGIVTTQLIEKIHVFASVALNGRFRHGARNIV